MKKRFPDELFIGIGMTVATITVIVGVLYLSNSNFLKKGYNLTLIAPHAGGLTTGDDVTIRGVRVGAVKQIAVRGDTVLVQLKLEKVKRLPVDSRFLIRERNLIGEHEVAIEPGHAPAVLKSGDRVQGEVASGFLQVTRQADNLARSVTNLAERLQAILGEENAANFEKALVNLNQATTLLQNLLEQSQRDIAATLANLRRGSNQLAALGDTGRASLGQVLANLQTTSERLVELTARYERVGTHLDSLLSAIYRGRGTLGKLATDDSLYIHMNRTFQNLDWLLNEIRRNPKKFLKVKVSLF